MKVLVVDDHVLIRDALRAVIGSLQPGAIVLESSNCRGAMHCLAEHLDVELILLDLALPDANGLDMLVELRRRYPAVGVAVLSAHQDRETIQRAFDLGALGFMPKSADRAVLVNALRLIFAGSVYVPPEILLVRPPSPSPNGKGPAAPSSRLADFGLTRRQVEVLALMTRGFSNKAISRTLNVAEPTVRCHVSAILSALDATSRTEAVAIVTELGLQLTPPTIAT